MARYLLLDILILLFPLILSARWKFRYADNYRYLFPAIAIVGGAFIAWDVVVTSLGHWAFNDRYVLGVRLFGLPVEELLFFVVVPFSCIFIYENLEFFVPSGRHAYPRGALLLAAALFFVGAAVVYPQQYTMAALTSCGIFLVLAFFLDPGLLGSRNYWAYIGLCLIPFVLFNFLLTSLPVVTYNPDAIWGGDGWWHGRFLTIPLEDFFYNYSMLSLYLLAYVVLKRRSLSGPKNAREPGRR